LITYLLWLYLLCMCKVETAWFLQHRYGYCVATPLSMFVFKTEKLGLLVWLKVYSKASRLADSRLMPY